MSTDSGLTLAPATISASEVYPHSQFSRGMVAPAVQTASGESGAGSNPAMFWIAVVLLLVAARFVFEMAPEK